MTSTVRLTTAQALVRWLTAQYLILDDGTEQPVFGGVFAIFGHGNVTCLGEALYAARGALPTHRGQNEQGMALAAAAYAKARRRRQIMVATTSIGPGALNLVTAAGVALANRLPILLLSGDTFASRIPDPVLQQVEHFDDPTATVNDAFRAVTRYWDRVTRPEQLLSSLPQALATMLDPGDCGPAFLGLPQDVQAQAHDFPERFFTRRVHRIARPRPDSTAVADAAALIRSAQRPLVIAGGGVHYSSAEAQLEQFVTRHGLPVAETVAGKVSLPWDHDHQLGPIGVTGGTAANAVAAEADVVIAVGTRLQDFTTGSWTVFQHDEVRIVGINAARFDAVKHGSLPVVGDARETLAELDAALGDWRAPDEWLGRGRAEAREWNTVVAAATAASDTGAPSYAQVIGAVNAAAGDGDIVLTAAGGLPGELNKTWHGRVPMTFDCEYGFSCMGYEVSGAWGAALARPDATVFSLVGDGSWLMLSADVYSAVLSGVHVVYVLCDNGGYAVIERLQVDKGGASFNNMLDDSTRMANPVRVDFAAHAASLGAAVERVDALADLPAALTRARDGAGVTVIVIETDPGAWTPGDAWWEVGVPEVSERPAVRSARADSDAAKTRQRPL